MFQPNEIDFDVMARACLCGVEGKKLTKNATLQSVKTGRDICTGLNSTLASRLRFISYV